MERTGIGKDVSKVNHLESKGSKSGSSEKSEEATAQCENEMQGSSTLQLIFCSGLFVGPGMRVSSVGSCVSMEG
jgi:hypothetical protein